MGTTQFLGYYIAPFVVMSLIVVWSTWTDCRRIRQINKLKATIEHYKHSQYLREYGYDLDECEDLHLAGDCPLCGAK